MLKSTVAPPEPTSSEGGRSHPFLHKSIRELLVQSAPPAIASSIGFSLHGLLDMGMIGHFLGSKSVAALCLLIPVFTLIQGLSGMLAGGIASALSRRIGEGDEAAIKLLNRLIPLLSLCFSGASFLLLWFIPTWLIPAEYDPQWREQLLGYAKWMILVQPFSAWNMVFKVRLTAMGAFRWALLITLVDLGLDAFATFSMFSLFPNSLSALAQADLLAQMLLCLGLRLSARSLGLSECRSDGPAVAWTGARELLRDIQRNGFPALNQQVLTTVRQALLFQVAARVGHGTDLAVLGAAFRLFGFLSLPVIGLMSALQPILGIHAGAKRMERMPALMAAFLATSLAFLLPAIAFICLTPQTSMGFFLGQESMSSTQTWSIRFIFLATALFPLASLGLTLFSALGKGHNNTRIFWLRNLVVFPLLLSTLVWFDGSRGVFLALALDQIVFALVVIFLIRVEMRLWAK